MAENRPKQPGITAHNIVEWYNSMRDEVDNHAQKLKDALTAEPDRADSREVTYDRGRIDGENGILNAMQAFLMTQSVEVTPEAIIDGGSTSPEADS